MPNYRNVLIKWLGGNGYNAKLLETLYPEHKTYYDPFLGGGTTLQCFQNSIVGDSNKTLIDIWKLCKTDPETLSKEYKERHNNLLQWGEGYYYEIRDRFNQNQNPHDFLWLTRTCVNGLIRFNKQGKFNSPIHKGRNGIKPEKFNKTIYYWHGVLQNKQITHGDYRETLSTASRGNFALLDPPYLRTPKGMYGQDFDFVEFYNILDQLNQKGVKWILTFDAELPQGLSKRMILGKRGLSPFSKLKQTGETQQDFIYMNF